MAEKKENLPEIPEELSSWKRLFLKLIVGKHYKKMAEEVKRLKSEYEAKVVKIYEKGEELEEKVYIDVTMPFAYATQEFMNELKLLEPFGTGNPKPVFAQRNMTFLSMRIMGKTGDMSCL